MARGLTCVVIAVTILATACGSSDEPAAVGLAPSSTTTAAAAPTTTTVPATPAPLPPETSSTEPANTGVPLPEAQVDELAAELHLLLPRTPEAATVLDMDPIYLWWFPTGSPDAVFLERWWDLPAIGCGVYSSRGEDPEGVEAAVQLAIYSTPDAARAGARAAAGLPRFAAAAAELAAAPGFEDGAGFVVIDREAWFEEEGEAPPPVVRWFSIGRIDRVVAIGGIRVDGERDVSAALTGLMEAVAARAARYAELTAEPDPLPGGFPQPMPAILFAGPDPTFDSLGIDEIEAGSWSVRRCAEGDCREVSFDGDPFTHLVLEAYPGVPRRLVEGLRAGRPGEALAEWVAEMWGGEVVMSEGGLVRQLEEDPTEVRLGAWGLHETSVVWIGVGDPEFEALDAGLVVDFTPVFDALIGAAVAPGP